VLKRTRLEKLFAQQPELFFDLALDNYIKLISKFIARLNPGIVLERFTSESPKEMIIYPDWKGKKNFEISHMVAVEMRKQNLIQGMNFQK
jgi:radical SAM superfamily enzyme